jgi:integration host factor subunit beta
MSGAVTKRDLVKLIAGRTGLKQGDVHVVVQSLFDSSVKDMTAGNRIELRDFGVFEARHKKARVARNPQTGKAVAVPERVVPHFKPGRMMKELISKKK